MRALETNCDVFMKATKVAGVYTSDPEKNPDAEFLPKISYKEVLSGNIQVMDHTAITLAKENNMPIVVFSLREEGNLKKILSGIGHYSLIS